MKSVKTENSNHNFGPPNSVTDGSIIDLPCQIIPADGENSEIIRSVWKITDEERTMIANGANIELNVWWIGAFPPIAISVTDEKEIEEKQEAE